MVTDFRSLISDFSLEMDFWRFDLEEYDLSALPGPEAKRVSPVNK
jgi:hypothetical protein